MQNTGDVLRFVEASSELIGIFYAFPVNDRIVAELAWYGIETIGFVMNRLVQYGSIDLANI